jgi:hypothetical protein
MNKRLLEMAIRARIQMCSNERLEEFAYLIIQDILNIVENTNLKDKTFTTYDEANLEYCKVIVKESILNVYNKPD